MKNVYHRWLFYPLILSQEFNGKGADKEAAQICFELRKKFPHCGIFIEQKNNNWRVVSYEDWSELRVLQYEAN
jgi:hypothetical protein